MKKLSAHNSLIVLLNFMEPNKGMDAQSVLSIFSSRICWCCWIFCIRITNGQEKGVYSSSSGTGNDEDWVNTDFVESKSSGRRGKSKKKNKKKIKLKENKNHIW